MTGGAESKVIPTFVITELLNMIQTALAQSALCEQVRILCQWGNTEYTLER